MNQKASVSLDKWKHLDIYLFHFFISYLTVLKMGRNGLFFFSIVLALSSHHTLRLHIAVSEQRSCLRLQIPIPSTP